MVSNMKRAGASLAAALIGAVMVCGASAPASAGGRHYIRVDPHRLDTQKWSVYGDLYDGSGRKVYHWQETGKNGAKDYVRWEYTDGGGGWIDLYIDPAPGQRQTFLHLPLNGDHCYEFLGTNPDGSRFIWNKSC